MRSMSDLRLIAITAVLFLSVFTVAIDFRYHQYKEMAQFLHNFTKIHSGLARSYSIGKSVEGRDLIVVELSGVKGSTIGVPNVKLIGNIHGNEAVGREILLHFLEFMVENYENNSTIRWFLDNTRLHILPSLNPDGFENASMGLCDRGLGRDNANGSDLNRSFPDFFRKNQMSSQPETIAVQKWMYEIPFILSASLHGGALVANYPFENYKEDAWDLALRWFNETLSTNDDSSRTVPLKFPQLAAMIAEGAPSLAPDDDVFQHLASLYANRHPTMHLGKPCQNNPKKFDGGITNGAAWYKITGGMQDYNYAFHGCMEITLEISCCKYPKDTDLPHLWEENKLALLDYIMEAHRGVKGQIIDGVTKNRIANATLKIITREMNFYSSNNGEFWRILKPGYYELLVSANGYETQKISFTVPYPKRNTLPLNLNVKMFPLGYVVDNTILTTDSSTDFNSNNIGNPVAKIVRTVNNSHPNEIIVERTSAIKSESFMVNNSLLITLISFIVAFIMK